MLPYRQSESVPLRPSGIIRQGFDEGNARTNIRALSVSQVLSLRLLKDEKMLETFKKQAFEVACKFDLQNVLPMYEEVYRQAYKWRYKNAFD